MDSRPIAVIAAHGFARKISDANAQLLRNSIGEWFNIDEAFDHVFGSRVRRASRFVKFANLCAHSALRQSHPQSLKAGRLGLFLGTGLGNVPDMVAFGAEVLAHHGSAVSPAHFINTVSNAGLFYVARELEIQCTSTVLSQEAMSFEMALLSASVQLADGVCTVALVGGVDVFDGPVDAMLKRSANPRLTADTIGEGAGFVLLTSQPGADDNVLGWLPPLSLDRSLLDDSRFDFRRISGDYHTASAFGFAQAFVGAANDLADAAIIAIESV